MSRLNITEATGRAVEILDRLVAFPTLSAQTNLELIGYIRDYLAGHGIESSLSLDAAGERANIYATIGPEVSGGVILSGHTDVVPVEGQDWTSDPFRLHRSGTRLHGRGAVDMKGFLACCLAAVPAFTAANLAVPIHIAFSYDEEIGGLGMPDLLTDIASKRYSPSIAIVGEPTGMEIISGHKGGLELVTEFTGVPVHSSDPRKGVSAIWYAARLVNRLEQIAAEYAAKPKLGSRYEPPYTTLTAGRIAGGLASNIIAADCAVTWEIRPMPGDDGMALLGRINGYVAELDAEMRALSPDAGARTITNALIPPLNDEDAGDAIALIRSITGLNSDSVVSFGTDAGYFCGAGISTAVFGPGDINRAHKADEYIEISEISACLGFLDALASRLER